MKTTASQVLQAVIGFFRHFCSEFSEKISVGAAKGCVRFLKETDLSNGSASMAKDGWLKLSVNIALVKNWDLQEPIRQLLLNVRARSLPKIDKATIVRNEGIQKLLGTPVS